MNRIKTREKTQGIKTIDKAALASERMRQAAIRTKKNAAALTEDNSHSQEEYASDKVQYGMEDIGRETAHSSVNGTKQVLRRGKEYAQQKSKNAQTKADSAPSSAETASASPTSAQTQTERYQAQGKKYASDTAIKRRQNNQRQSQSVTEENNPTPQTIKMPQRDIRQTDRAIGKSTIQSVQSTKQPETRTIKTAQRTEKVSVKTAEASAKTAEITAKTTKQTAQRMRVAAKKAEEAVKKTAEAVAAAARKVAEGVKSLISAIAAGGSVSAIIIVVILLIGLIVGSCFGIFFSSEEKNDGSERMFQVVREINKEFDDEIERIKNSVDYDVLELHGGHAEWQDILAVYAVKTTTDKDDGMEVATVDAVKKNLLRKVFWDMTEIDYEVKFVITGSDDNEVTTVYLSITVISKTADEMAEEYGFDEDQMEQLHELMDDAYRPLWMAVIYGIEPGGGGSTDIVAVALSQIGNVGGEPYWSWYGYPSRVEWCACFVSWCANECGYIESGAVPKYSYCPFGVEWFKSHGQWLDGSETPEPGMIVFFDWDTQDGVSDHTGIVEKAENGRVYTVEGNSNDGCRERDYAIGSSVIMGYGCISR